MSHWCWALCKEQPKEANSTDSDHEGPHDALLTHMGQRESRQGGGHGLLPAHAELGHEECPRVPQPDRGRTQDPSSLVPGAQLRVYLELPSAPFPCSLLPYNLPSLISWAVCRLTEALRMRLGSQSATFCSPRKLPDTGQEPTGWHQ